MVPFLAGVLLGIAASRHEHLGIECGDAPASAMLGVALQGFCHGSLRLDTPPVTVEKVASAVAAAT